MNADYLHSAFPGAPLISDFWGDEAPVVQNRRLEHEHPVPVFGIRDSWDLRALGWNPAAGRASAKLLFRSFDDKWNLRARELAIALLNPGHVVLRAREIYRPAVPAHLKTIRARLGGLKHFATWHANNYAEAALHDLKQAHLDRYLNELKSEGAPSSIQQAIDAVRELHTHNQVLTGGGIPFRPWRGATTIALSGRHRSNELSTPVMPPNVWWPLIRACWQYIELFSHDIFTAAEEWAALNRPLEDRVGVRDHDKALKVWLNTQGSAVPLHRLSYGRFRQGEIHWTLLSLLITDGHSKSMFAGPTERVVLARRERVIQAISAGTVPAVPGGLSTRAANVVRADASTGPWIDGFDPATIRAHLKILRNACYVFCAALTMMRDSELLSIKKGALTTFYGAPAVTSQLWKGRRGKHLRNWWIIEPVARAIAVAERLALGDVVFGSTQRNHNDDGRTVHFDRHDELKKFIPQLNALGPDAGLEPIPEIHLSPHMFRRTMAVITAQQPDGEIALGIQLKHAAHRAVANGTTSGYTTETPEWAAEFEHELQEAVASRLVGMWSTQSTDGIQLAGAGAQRFRDELNSVEGEAGAAVKIGDERLLRTLLRDRFSTLRWGTVNHCLGIPEQAACLKDLPPEATAAGMLPNRCQPTTCGNSVITDEHAPIWIAEERDLFAKLRDRKMAEHNREQLETELASVQKITRRFTNG